MVKDPHSELAGDGLEEGDGKQRLVFLDSRVRDQAQAQQDKQKTGKARGEAGRKIQLERLNRMRVLTAQGNSIRQGLGVDGRAVRDSKWDGWRPKSRPRAFRTCGR